ncbi:cytochrome c oxidase assembly protein [Planococcus halotolerans]|uniref:cytochrome c oxidase assembly protein n=1 Tax=Planococcus halotolerans TaxID=2233542 RepID=UPI001092BC08|nr:cytochrome c oxidase assembly protein [Planococcus halotolerans]QHJ69411.1 cytochrome c oxidase assembly protein [Planococcus halotolerans]
MHDNHALMDSGGFLPLFLLIALLGISPYLAAVYFSNQKYRNWPLQRIVFWSFGIISATAALVGPLAEQAHVDFRMHMAVHLLLGMLAPLLIAMSCPMTLLLRTLNISAARTVMAVLKNPPFRLINHPVTAALLNIGGLYVLYLTSLYHLMNESAFLYAVIHLHIFLAGYLFTVSIVYFDVTPHRFSFLYRSIVLIVALAGHKILAKTLYATPPEGVPRTEAEAGSMLMYYGGDLIDAVLIFYLCWHWYKSTAKREPSFIK